MTRYLYKKTKTRRGLMNVISGVFVILVLTSALNVTIWTVGQQDRISQVVIEKQNADLNKLDESIGIADIKVNNNKLNLTITNEGSARAILKSLYVVNETSQQQYRYDLNIAVDGRNSVKDIGQSDPAFPLANDAEYSIRVISESGNSVAAKIRPVSEVALPMSLYVIPSTVTTLENVTLMFSVMNNLTEGDVLAGPLTPTLDKSLSCTEGEDCQFTDYISPAATIVPNGQSTLFKWVFKVTAPVGTTMTFNASLTNAKQGNYVIETGRVEIVQEVVRSSEIIVSSSLLQKPEVYLIAPGPFGESSNKGYWAVVMVNPINEDMKVKMVAINLYSSTTDASAKILAKNCAVTMIIPSSGWDCLHDGLLRWHNLDNPITVKGNSSYTFLAKVPSTGITDPQSAFMISVSVFTDLGQFSRQGYASNMYSSATAVANVYLTDTINTVDAASDSHVLGNITVTGGLLGKRIHVAVSDFDTSSSRYIQSGATLIINMPLGFPNITIPNPLPLGFSSASKVEYPDGTTQIRAVTSEHVGDVSLLPEAKVFYFDVDVPSTGTTQTYVMHTFLEGKTNTSPAFPAGAFGTFAITVCPDSGCA
jgi:hypothetical protein